MKYFFVWAGAALLLTAHAQELPQGATALTEMTDDITAPMEGGMFLETEPEEEEEAPMQVVEDKVKNTQLKFLMDTGIEYQEDGENEDAERAYLLALEKDPNNAAIRLRLSTLYLVMGKNERAVEMMEELVTDFPNSEAVHNNLAWAYTTGSSVRDIKKALWHVREALLINPISPSLWNTLAEAYYVSGEYDKALRSSEHAIDILVHIDEKHAELPAFKEQLLKIQRAKEATKLINSFKLGK